MSLRMALLFNIIFVILCGFSKQRVGLPRGGGRGGVFWDCVMYASVFLEQPVD